MSLKAQAPSGSPGRNRRGDRHDAARPSRPALDDAKLRLLHGYMLSDVGEQAPGGRGLPPGDRPTARIGGAYWSLANLKTVRFSEADLAAMSEQLAVMAPLDSTVSPSSSRWARHSRMPASTRSPSSTTRWQCPAPRDVYYDRAVLHDVVERSRSTVPAGIFRRARGWGSERAEPIFIVGMPRSGSTLLDRSSPATRRWKAPGSCPNPGDRAAS